MNFENEYIKILIQFTKNEINFDDLFNQFYFKYMDESSDLGLKTEEFYSEICEKMDYTLDEGELDSEDRKYGWINQNEFKIWLVEYLRDIKL